jgi:hypothetical protein
MKFNQLIIGSFLAITVFASCKKVIDVKETDFIGGDVALLTVQIINKVLSEPMLP